MYPAGSEPGEVSEPEEESDPDEVSEPEEGSDPEEVSEPEEGSDPEEESDPKEESDPDEESEPGSVSPVSVSPRFILLGLGLPRLCLLVPGLPSPVPRGPRVRDRPRRPPDDAVERERDLVAYVDPVHRGHVVAVLPAVLAPAREALVHDLEEPGEVGVPRPVGEQVCEVLFHVGRVVDPPEERRELDLAESSGPVRVGREDPGEPRVALGGGVRPPGCLAGGLGRVLGERRRGGEERGDGRRASHASFRLLRVRGGVTLPVSAACALGLFGPCPFLLFLFPPARSAEGLFALFLFLARKHGKCLSHFKVYAELPQSRRTGAARGSGGRRLFVGVDGKRWPAALVLFGSSNGAPTLNPVDRTKKAVSSVRSEAMR
ncbi:hypothetical protein THAOC_01669 [Thalassiosira oceanica]|uniref:Uncharacterized protein n=1 Tax=Thalassiosira oceanica TaxID=159749 RepID=K0THT3_THAOC|nr:hypothetical protein THAOC_01669 [Thalassiosira oceanica]|eukprot:EJK76564.1 hypothetical protein THAOC_01669 [Thalassiosira oceanica]